MIFEIIIEDEQGGSVSQSELQDWADRFDLTMPVLYDEGYGVLTEFVQGSIGLPYTVIVDQGEIVDVRSPGVDGWERMFE